MFIIIFMYCQGSLQDKPLSQREHFSLSELTSVHSPEPYVHTTDREGGRKGRKGEREGESGERGGRKGKSKQE